MRNEGLVSRGSKKGIDSISANLRKPEQSASTLSRIGGGSGYSSGIQLAERGPAFRMTQVLFCIEPFAVNL